MGSDALHDIRNHAFNLLFDVLDAFLLLVSQIKARLQRVSTTAVYLNELLVRKEPMLLHQPGANGEILLTACVVVAEVVAVRYALAVEVPLPGDELDAAVCLLCRKDGPVEVRQHLVPVLQRFHLEGRCCFHESHVLSGHGGDLIDFVLEPSQFQILVDAAVISDAAVFRDLANGMVISEHFQRVVRAGSGAEAALTKDRADLRKVIFPDFFFVPQSVFLLFVGRALFDRNAKKPCSPTRF